MRIAVSGTHFSGKSTLVGALEKKLEGYSAIDEPYFLLEQEGYIFSDPPLLEDFAEQFKRSIRLIEESDPNTLFDRCPLDFLAYAMVISKRVDAQAWMEEMEEAIDLLDLIVFLPIESRDRISVPHSEDLKFRWRVNEKMEEILFEGSWVLEVMGELPERVEKVMKAIK